MDRKSDQIKSKKIIPIFLFPYIKGLLAQFPVYVIKQFNPNDGNTEQLVQT